MVGWNQQFNFYANKNYVMCSDVGMARSDWRHRRPRCSHNLRMSNIPLFWSGTSMQGHEKRTFGAGLETHVKLCHMVQDRDPQLSIVCRLYVDFMSIVCRFNSHQHWFPRCSVIQCKTIHSTILCNYCQMLCIHYIHVITCYAQPEI